MVIRIGASEIGPGKAILDRGKKSWAQPIDNNRTGLSSGWRRATNAQDWAAARGPRFARCGPRSPPPEEVSVWLTASASSRRAPAAGERLRCTGREGSCVLLCAQTASLFTHCPSNAWGPLARVARGAVPSTRTRGHRERQTQERPAARRHLRPRLRPCPRQLRSVLPSTSAACPVRGFFCVCGDLKSDLGVDAL